MLKTNRGDAPPPEAVSIETAAQLSDLGRSTIYKALQPDAAKRGGLPFLPTLQVGRSRRVRLATLRQWLAELEASSGAAA